MLGDKVLDWYVEIDLETYEEEIQSLQSIPLLFEELNTSYRLVRTDGIDKQKAIRIFNIVRLEVIKRLKEME